MISPWNKLYDPAKDRRYGNLFFATFVLLFVLVGIAALIRNEFSEIQDQNPDVQIAAFIVLTGTAVFGSIFIRRKFRRDSPPKGRFLIQPMSRDEIIKARSKLVRVRK